LGPTVRPSGSRTGSRRRGKDPSITRGKPGHEHGFRESWPWPAAGKATAANKRRRPGRQWRLRGPAPVLGRPENLVPWPCFAGGQGKPAWATAGKRRSAPGFCIFVFVLFVPLSPPAGRMAQAHEGTGSGATWGRGRPSLSRYGFRGPRSGRTGPRKYRIFFSPVKPGPRAGGGGLGPWEQIPKGWLVGGPGEKFRARRGTRFGPRDPMARRFRAGRPLEMDRPARGRGGAGPRPLARTQAGVRTGPRMPARGSSPRDRTARPTRTPWAPPGKRK